MDGSFGLTAGLSEVLVSPPPRPCAAAAPTDATISAPASKRELVCSFIAASFELPWVNVGGTGWFPTPKPPKRPGRRGGGKHHRLHGTVSIPLARRLRGLRAQGRDAAASRMDR